MSSDQIFDEDLKQTAQKYKLELHCEYCKSQKNIKFESARTNSFWEGDIDSPENPNRPLLFCRYCAEEHHAFWDDMLSTYSELTPEKTLYKRFLGVFDWLFKKLK